MRPRNVVVAVTLGALAVGALITPHRVVDASPPPPVAAPGKYLGASTCDGANCHAKPEARERPPYLTEFTSWSALKEDDTPYDRHSYAWRRLRGSDKGGDDRSPEIMAKLNQLEGTKDAAETSQRCLTCHGVSVHDYGVGKQNPGAAVGLSRELQGARYRADEGVTCDGCHGPAEKWLKLHDKADWTINEWKKLGGPDGGSQALYDQYGIYYSKDLSLWANQCVRCHLRIDTNLLDAGHPDLLSFELFSHDMQVPHWRDYAAETAAPELPGAGPTHAAAEWLIGQAVCVREGFEQLHARSSGAQFNTGTAAHLRAAFSRAAAHLSVLRHALPRVGQAKAADELAGLVRDLTPLLAKEPPVPAEIAPLADKARQAARALVAPLGTATLDGAACAAVMKAIALDPAGAQDQLAADQLRLALYALNYARLYATDPDALSADPPTDAAMNAIYELYGSPEPTSDGWKAGLAKVREAVKGR